MRKLTLQTVAGPERGTFVVDPGSQATIGRAVECDICLLNEGVSRRHATVLGRDEDWYVRDDGSTPGTFVNGVQLTAGDPAPLQSGDMVGIGPWTFRALVGGDVTTSVDLDPGDETQVVERLDLAALVSSAGRRLKLLTRCMARIDAVPDEATQAKVALETVLDGTGYGRGAVLRRVGEADEVEVVAASEGDLHFSSSLLRQAADGHVCTLFTKDTADASRSIAELGIHSALCVPIRLGGSVVAFLYLDARGGEDRVEPDAAGFCEAVASTYGLSLANSKRQELENRQQVLRSQLAVAHDVQKLILPPADGRLGFLAYAMRQLPGLFVAGDVVDVLALGADRVAVCLGDVSGHGVGSGMLMAVTQSYVHAQLRETADPVAVVERVNRYVARRVSGGRFVSLWIGVFERGGTLRYVDAGHGHWFHAPQDGAPRPPADRGGIPVGIDGGYAYEAQTIALAPSDRIVVYSDGLVEQVNAAGEQFGKERLMAAFAGGGPVRGVVDRAFEALALHAGTPNLDDDATAAAVEFTP